MTPEETLPSFGNSALHFYKQLICRGNTKWFIGG
jgi:hypothetical protein